MTKLFELGQVIITEGVAAIAHKTDIDGHLAKHQSGDRGDVHDDDQEANDEAVKNGDDQIMSRYPIDPFLSPAPRWKRRLDHYRPRPDHDDDPFAQGVLTLIDQQQIHSLQEKVMFLLLRSVCRFFPPERNSPWRTFSRKCPDIPAKDSI